MDDASPRPFLPEGRLAELFAGPQLLSSEERRALADAVLTWLRAEHGEDLVAVALYGSTASGKDGPFSDVEMWAVLEDRAGAETDLEWVWGPGKLEVDLMTVTQAITRAADVDERWPLTHARFVLATPLWEAPQQTGFVDRIRAAAADLPDVARREAMAECVLNLYELLGKLRNFRLGPPTDVTRLACDFAVDAACLVALHHRHVFGSGRRLWAEAHRLEGPEGYRPLLERLMRGQLAPPAKVIDQVEQFWGSLPGWTGQIGLELATCLRPSPDPSGVRTPEDPPADRPQIGEGPPPLGPPRRRPRRRVFGSSSSTV